MNHDNGGPLSLVDVVESGVAKLRKGAGRRQILRGFFVGKSCKHDQAQNAHEKQKQNPKNKHQTAPKKLAEMHDAIVQATISNQHDIFEIILIHLPGGSLSLFGQNVFGPLHITRRE